MKLISKEELDLAKEEVNLLKAIVIKTPEKS